MLPSATQSLFPHILHSLYLSTSTTRASILTLYLFPLHTISFPPRIASTHILRANASRMSQAINHIVQLCTFPPFHPRLFLKLGGPPASPPYVAPPKSHPETTVSMRNQHVMLRSHSSTKALHVRGMPKYR